MKINLKKILFRLGQKLLSRVNFQRFKRQHNVVLIADHLKPRVCKIGYALRKKKYFVILLYERKNAHEIKQLDMKCFDRVLTFEDYNELFCKSIIFSPLVYHVFSEAHIQEYVIKLIENKHKIGKIVYDQYDVLRGLYSKRNKKQEEMERYCLENADGLCCRHFETQYLKKKFHYQYKGKRILFLDYCWNCYHNEINLGNSNKKLKLVYGGRILPYITSDVMKSMEWEGFKFIADTVKEQQGYFVIIPNKKWEERENKDFISLAQENNHIKLKAPMSFKQLIKYESRMDYGIDCVEFQNKMNEYKKKFGDLYDYEAKSYFYATNKYFDYLDAGIPAIYGRKRELFGRLLERYGGAIYCPLEELPKKFRELERNRDINKDRVRIARDKLAIERQIDRLIDFYISI